MDEIANSLLSASDQSTWRAVTAPHAGDWLLAMPIASCGLKLNDEAVRVAVDLLLGANIREPHTCVCGQQVTAQGHRGLSYMYIRSFCRQARYGIINDVIYRALSNAGRHTDYNVDRLQLITRQSALLILRCYIGSPKLILSLEMHPLPHPPETRSV